MLALLLSPTMDYFKIITTYGISYKVLAAKIGMPRGTFNNKINPKQPAYKFTEAEEEKIRNVLLDIALDVTAPYKTIDNIRVIECSVLPNGEHALGYIIDKHIKSP